MKDIKAIPTPWWGWEQELKTREGLRARALGNQWMKLRPNKGRRIPPRPGPIQLDEDI